MSAKAVFQETGFERASMDAIAAQAHTSKRSIYAYFADKDDLFLASLDLVRELYLETLGHPGDYAEETEEAVARFCGRFEQKIAWEGMVKTFRLIVADAERLPEAAGEFFDAVFISTQARLADFLAERRDLDPDAAQALALALLGRTAFPRIFRTLLNVEPPIRRESAPTVEELEDDVDLDAIRAAVAAELPRDGGWF